MFPAASFPRDHAPDRPSCRSLPTQSLPTLLGNRRHDVVPALTVVADVAAVVAAVVVSVVADLVAAFTVAAGPALHGAAGDLRVVRLADG